MVKITVPNPECYRIIIITIIAASDFPIYYTLLMIIKIAVKSRYSHVCKDVLFYLFHFDFNFKTQISWKD